MLFSVGMHLFCYFRHIDQRPHENCIHKTTHGHMHVIFTWNATFAFLSCEIDYGSHKRFHIVYNQIWKVFDQREPTWSFDIMKFVHRVNVTPLSASFISNYLLDELLCGSIVNHFVDIFSWSKIVKGFELKCWTSNF